MPRTYEDPREIFVDTGKFIESEMSFSLINNSGMQFKKDLYAVRLDNAFLRIFRGDKDRSGYSFNDWLNRVTRKLLKEIDREIKTLKHSAKWAKDPLDNYSFDFVAFVLKTEMVEEYNRLAELCDRELEEEIPEEIEIDEWFRHEVYHPGESLEEWQKREAKESEELRKLFTGE